MLTYALLYAWACANTDTTTDGEIKVYNNPDTFVTGKLMYDGMSGVLTASRPFVNATTYIVDPKTVGGVGTVCGYTFYVLVDSKGTTISWTMDDNYNKALAAVQTVQKDPAEWMAAKTAKANMQLNELVPYFRCSDDSIVKLYYYLWSLYVTSMTHPLRFFFELGGGILDIRNGICSTLSAPSRFVSTPPHLC